MCYVMLSDLFFQLKFDQATVFDSTIYLLSYFRSFAVIASWTSRKRLTLSC